MLHKDHDGKELWNIQDEFTHKFWKTKGGMPDSTNDARMTDVTKDYALHMIAEVTEVVQELSWRMHRASKGEIDRDNLLEELIDVQKFTWGLMQVWGFTWDQFREEFKRKSTVVEQRFVQEQTFPKIKNDPCAIIDIDGILAAYPDGFYAWCIENFFPTHSYHDFGRLYKSMDILNREELKKKYRQSGAKRTLPLVPGARELLECIRRRSQLKIILLTNRPYAEFYRIYPDTLYWLAQNKLPFDGIIWGRDKGIDALSNFKNICWAVDDDVKNIERFREANITAVHVENKFPTHSTMELYKLAERVPKLEDLGFIWNSEPEAKDRMMSHLRSKA